MKQLNYTQNRPGSGRSFDKGAEGGMLNLMQLVKAIRGAAALGVSFFALGCETTSESEAATPKTTTVVISAPAPGLVVTQPTPVAEPNTPAPAATQTVVDQKETNAPVAAAAVAAPAGASTTNDLIKAAEILSKSDSTNAPPVVTEEVAPTRPANLQISDSAQKVIKLAEAGVDENVMLAYVAKAEGKFELDADEIVYLSDVGVPSAVLTAMLKHDGEDPGKLEALTDAPKSDIPQPLPGNLPGTQTAQAPVEITTNYVPNTVAVGPQPQPQTVVVQQPQTVIVTPQPEAVTYFYDSLSPYGSWFVTSDYGWVWQPTVAVVDSGWRPYGHRGNWVWSTSGWYWHSDYSWGWAPFHYGRWHHYGGRGWCWVPDRTWGPAWVSWRTTADYCGWAPLPPAAVYTPGFGFSYYGSSVGFSFGFGLSSSAYCFTPIHHFHDRHVWNHRVPHHTAHGIFERSSVHNRYDTGRDNRIVNNGVPRERVERAINRELRPAEIRTAPANEARGRVGPRERVERNGADTVIYRPESPRAAMASTGRRDNINPSSTPSTPAGAVGSVGRGNANARETGREFSRARSVNGITPSAPASNPTLQTEVGRETMTERRQLRPRTIEQATSVPPPAAVTPTPEVSNPGRNALDRRAAESGLRSRPNIAAPSTPAPAPAAINPTPAPDTQNVRRELPRRDMGRIAESTPATTPTQREFGRRDIGNRVNQPITPAPQVSAPPTVSPDFGRARPQISAPAPQISTPAPQTSARVPRTSTPPPQITTPAQQSARVAPRSTSPSPTPNYNTPPASRGNPNPSGGYSGRSASPAPSPAPARSAPSAAPSNNSGRGGGSAESAVRGRFERR